ncbi:ATP synthase subunit s, mitochondrial [Episyrphus balteatus]|uniref:ATP synthase subunit s, mitochondrial n=1 Tax=Episyrphus balteatus TaxID=286459 RepID=UPI002485416B|nr:ATP synthase subunit s, mitochondrial [Episyrphus balteatus]
MISLKVTNILQGLLQGQNIKSRQLWAYVAIAFNKVDHDRLKLVGPDRMCAEWVLKNGGAVSFVQAPGRLLQDYNALPTPSTRVQIKEIDATDSSIMKLGMEHLKSCKHIDRVILNRCKHLESDGLTGLTHIKDTLKHLQISSCYNIDDQGLLVLKELTQLKSLLMFDLTAVNDLEKVIEEIKPHLKECTISTKESI